MVKFLLGQLELFIVLRLTAICSPATPFSLSSMRLNATICFKVDFHPLRRSPLHELVRNHLFMPMEEIIEK